MNLLMMGARIRRGKKLRPAMKRLGSRNARILDTIDISINVPSTGVANTHNRASMPIERSWNSTNE